MPDIGKTHLSGAHSAMTMGNFATIGNQQSEAIAALVEKIVNGVDARLIDACLRAGVDPESPIAPQSIRAAVARFFEKKSNPTDRDGRISEWPDSAVTEQGRLLTVSATGYMPSAGKPSITIADQGEGQAPDSFPETFMSLHRSNKLRIPFVQGKFNMGGTGALAVLWRRVEAPANCFSPRSRLVGEYSASERDCHWGFTVVRREPPYTGLAEFCIHLSHPDERRRRAIGECSASLADEWPIFPEANDKVRDAYARSATVWITREAL